MVDGGDTDLKREVRRFILTALLTGGFPTIREVCMATGADYRDAIRLRGECLSDEVLDEDLQLAYGLGHDQGKDDEKRRQRVLAYAQFYKELIDRPEDQYSSDEMYYRGVLHILPEEELTQALIRGRFNEAIRLFHPDTNPRAIDLRYINRLQEARDYLLALCEDKEAAP